VWCGVENFERGEVKGEVKLGDLREWSLESFGMGEEMWEGGSE